MPEKTTIITERLLQFIWQFQYFNTAQLTTVEGETLQIVYPGIYNTNQGPDFLQAKTKTGTTAWAGNIELHVQSSHWNDHKHSNDKNYNNIILHVVWINDVELNLPFPVLELQSRVSHFLLNRYNQMLGAVRFIPCEKSIHLVGPLIWKSWKDRLLAERLQQKALIVLDHLTTNNNHWEETFWWMLAHNFGIKVNSSAFEKVARSLSISILAKHKNQIHQLEALLFGQAGLLDKNFEDSYAVMLKKEYLFYKAKYKLQPVQEPLFFLRMRPANFPSVRLAQLAMLIHKSHNLFSLIKESKGLNEVKNLLNVTANDYWHYRYVFDGPAVYKEKNTGKQMVDNIIINTVVPVLFAWGLYNKEAACKAKALEWMEQIAPEKNSITNAFTSLQVENKNAFDSQALLRLKNDYCDKKRCLECAVGNTLLKPPVTNDR